MGYKRSSNGICCCNFTFVMFKLILVFLVFGKISASRLHIYTWLGKLSFTGVIYLKTGPVTSKTCCLISPTYSVPSV